MKPRKYTGTSDGPAQAKRPGTEQFVREVCALSGGALWNNGTWVVRNVRGKDVLSVHATGRAMDLSWRHLGDKGKPNGRTQALATIDYLIEHANLLRIEMVIDYFTQPHVVRGVATGNRGRLMSDQPSPVHPATGSTWRSPRCSRTTRLDTRPDSTN